MLRLGRVLADAEQRVKNRVDTIDRVRQQNAFAAAGMSEMQRMTAEDDFTQPATLDKFTRFLDDRVATIVGQHQGSEESRAHLAAQLEGRRAQLAAQAAQIAYDSQNKMIGDHIGAQLNTLVSEAYQKPDTITELFKKVDSVVDDMMPALRPGQERAFRRLGRERVAEGGLNALIMREQMEEADRLLTTPELGAVLGDEAKARVSGRIAAVRQAHAEADARGDALRSTLRAALGREPTAAEIQSDFGRTNDEGGDRP
jgi:hypothetical protein